MTVEERLLKKDAEEIEGIMKKGYDCLFDTLGYVAATKFISRVMQSGREAPADYTEWRRENLFENVSDEKFMSDLKAYAQTHNLE